MNEPDLVDLLSGEHTLDMPFRTVVLEHEIEAFPAPYSETLQKLAELADEDLLNATFAQEDPEYEDEDPYVLVGRLDDHEVRVSVEDDGEVLNVEGCIEVLNQLLEEVHSEMRYALIPDAGLENQVLISIEPAS